MDVALKRKVKDLITIVSGQIPPDHVGVVISDKWMPDKNTDRYYILSFSPKYLSLLENSHAIKTQYVLCLRTYVFKINDQEKDVHFINKTNKIIQMVNNQKAELFFKKKGEANGRSK